MEEGLGAAVGMGSEASLWVTAYGGAILFLLGIRTLGWHLQCWQIREYRPDRMAAYLRTEEGRKNIFNLWFFRGFFPRPRLSLRIGMMGVIVLLLTAGLYLLLLMLGLPLFWKVLVWERLLWLLVALSVGTSAVPVGLLKRFLFARAQSVVKKLHTAEENIAPKDRVFNAIGITGSFGKSSTKEILVHLLSMKYGAAQVLFTPENHNNEVAIARLIRSHASFFDPANKTKRFFVAEMGAYKKGEIAQICRFVQPHIGIITGINTQHLELFGSEKNILEAKFELAQACKDKVFYNLENDLLRQHFNQASIEAEAVPISTINTDTKITDAAEDRTVFTYGGKTLTLPWCGDFYVMNALLAVSVTRELGLSKHDIAQYFPSIPVPRKALHLRRDPSGGAVLHDTYSANPNGVLAAIKQLGQFPGMRIFIGMPLLELGDRSADEHRRIFQALRKIEAHVFWLKDDFAEEGEAICKELFHGKELAKLDVLLEHFGEGDGVLLESRLPSEVMKRFGGT